MALPGGYVDVAQDVNTEATANRKLKDKTGIEPTYLEQFKAYSGHERDPRGFSVTLAYFALIGYQDAQSQIATVEQAQWLDVASLASVSIAFDHRQIITDAQQRLVQKALYSMLPVYCLPAQFTIGQLKDVIETLIGRPIQRKSLIRRIESADMLEELDEMAITGKRQAKLYRVKAGAEVHHFQRNLEG
ncbi:nudix-related transcriptional regulator NrtR [Photobacterium aphoticum]|uniref:Nudix-related transcriptional regulator NrtR n=1 Tax=Photobacterium aphoticum TaxID=754436 RepID=A0A090QZE1_9GAMM|nr:nudix-related transcriptional regulator NrtR [Photobacterium aphoticum]